MFTPAARPTASSVFGLLRPNACQCRYKSKNPKSLHVLLLKDVPTVGFAGQAVPVKPGRMRNHLFPSRAATFITWKTRAELDQKIASINAEYEAKNAVPSKLSEKDTQRDLKFSSADWMRLTEAIPSVITLTRPATRTSTLFASVHLSDIKAALLKELQLNPMATPTTNLNGVEFGWDPKEYKAGSIQSGDRVGKTGRFVYTIKARGDKGNDWITQRTCVIKAEQQETLTN